MGVMQDLIKSLNGTIEYLNRSNSDMLVQLTRKAQQCNDLTHELSRLKQNNNHNVTNSTVDCDPVPRTKVSLQNEPQLTQPKTALLLIGSSHVSRFERIHDDMQLRSMSGAKTYDVLNMLQKHPNDDTGVVSIIVGSNDCSSKATPDDIIKRYECVLEEAKRVARDNVCVSSILPRLTSAAYNTKADILNDKLKALCSDMQCMYSLTMISTFGFRVDMLMIVCLRIMCILIVKGSYV